VANLSYAIVPGDGTAFAGRDLVAACVWDIPVGCGRLLLHSCFFADLSDPAGIWAKYGLNPALRSLLRKSFSKFRAFLTKTCAAGRLFFSKSGYHQLSCRIVQ
jgi:hypothetical protein